MKCPECSNNQMLTGLGNCIECGFCFICYHSEDECTCIIEYIGDEPEEDEEEELNLVP